MSAPAVLARVIVGRRYLLLDEPGFTYEGQDAHGLHRFVCRNGSASIPDDQLRRMMEDGRIVPEDPRG